MNEQPIHDAINRYEEAVSGIPDCFDCLTGQSIAELAAYAASLDQTNTITGQADKFIRGHLDMLATWRGHLDTLDSEIRADVVEGSIPGWAQKYLKDEARDLFTDTQALLHAIAEYHHGTSGPRLDPAYGHAYQLSNSVLSPF